MLNRVYLCIGCKILDNPVFYDCTYSCHLLMKRLVFWATMTALVLSGCEKETGTALVLSGCEKETGSDEDKIYTEDELGVIVEWGRCGWSEVKNETEATVKLTTSYPFGYHEDVTSDIVAGEMVKLDIGAAVPGVSIEESIRAVINLADGTEIVCVQSSQMTPWAERFYTNFEKEETYEVIDLDGKKLRHDLVVLTYHIDQTLIDLWKESQLIDGGWPAI